MNALPSSDDGAVVDACVLANVIVADLFLRAAKRAGAFIPKWSAMIIKETRRTMTTKFGWRPDEVASRLTAMDAAFPRASVSGYEPLIGQCSNDEGDRHVLACAIKAKATTIVTFNVRHFRHEHLSPWGVRAVHPQDYLLELYTQRAAGIWDQVSLAAEKRGVSLSEMLGDYAKHLPRFAERLLADLGNAS